MKKLLRLFCPLMAGKTNWLPAVVAAPAPPTSSNPVVPNYEGTSRPAEAPASKPEVLLVTKDHSLYSATRYWVEGNTLYYITGYEVRKSLPLDQLDLEFTRQLNKERNVPFDLGR